MFSEYAIFVLFFQRYTRIVAVSSAPINTCNTMQQNKILLIEDDASIRAMYLFKLQSSGFSVKAVNDGKTGLSEAEAWRPDLILLDLRMPNMGGDKMLEILRKTDWGASIRVIVLTNLNKNEAPTALRFLNVDRYVVKAHTTPAELVEIIREVLG